MIWRLSVEASVAAVTREAVPEAGVPGEAVAGKASLAHSMSMRPSLHNTAMRSQILNKWHMLPVQSD